MREQGHLQSVGKTLLQSKQKHIDSLSVQDEKRFRILIEKSTDMLLLSDENGDILYGSPSITEILGYSLEDFQNMPEMGFIHPDDVADFVKNKMTVLATPGRSLYSQQRLRHKNGHWVWCEGTDTNMLHESGIEAVVSNFRDISDKKIAEQQLIKSEAFNLGVINSLSSHIAVIDESGNILAVNASWKSFALENGEDTLVNTGIGSDYFEVCAKASKAGEKKADDALRGIKDVMSGRINDFYLEYPCHSPDCQQWFGMTVMRFENNEKMAVVSHKNITERILAEKYVADSEKRYRQIVETAQEGIWLVDADSRTIFVNRKMCEIFGYSEEEMIGRSSFSFKDDIGKKAEAQYIENRKLGIKETYESEFITKSGRKILTLISANPILDDEGAYIGALAMINDITDRKKMALKLAQSEARLTEAQAMAHIGNFEVDGQNQHEVWSDEMYKIFGVNKEEVVPSRELFLSFIHPDDMANVAALLSNCIERSDSSVAHFRFIRADGNLRYGYNEVRCELDNDRNVIRTFGIFQDITDAKLAEIKHNKMVNELVLRNTDLEQFGYIVSHNLRAPIANIIGASAVLKDPELSIEDIHSLTDGITQSVTKLDDVVKDLNHILEIRSQISTPKEVVKFSSLVDDIKKSVQHLIDKDNVEINYNFSAINELLTFRPYLYSIFFNLITNSIKYRRKEIKGIIEIKSAFYEDNIELLFSDNGMGIDLSRHGRDVFGLYKRFHPRIDGKGMGLFMVKTQVDALGGKISVTSTKDVGAEFRIEFKPA